MWWLYGMCAQACVPSSPPPTVITAYSLLPAHAHAPVGSPSYGRACRVVVGSPDGASAIAVRDGAHASSGRRFGVTKLRTVSLVGSIHQGFDLLLPLGNFADWMNMLINAST